MLSAYVLDGTHQPTNNEPRPVDEKLASRYVTNVEKFVTNSEASLAKTLKI